MSKEQIIWYLRLIPKYSGILGIAGLALLGFALMLYTQDLKPYLNDLNEREIALERKFQQLRAPTTAVPTGEALQKLNRNDTFTFFLRRLNDLAASNKVTISQVDYKSLPEADGKLMRYSMQFPANATYLELRRFLLELQTSPGVRVESLNLQRQQISDDRLAIQVQLSYLTEVR